MRARIGLVEAADARDADCAEIRVDLMDSLDRGVKASARARRHMRSCDGCSEYRTALRGMRRSFAALSPAGAGPLAMAAAKLLGLGGAGGGAAAGGSAAAGGGAVGARRRGTTVSACKVAAVVCTAALATGGAVEVRHLAAKHRAPAAARRRAGRCARGGAGAAAAPAIQHAAVFAPAPERVADQPRRHKRAKQEAEGRREDAGDRGADRHRSRRRRDDRPGRDRLRRRRRRPTRPAEQPAGGTGTAPQATGRGPRDALRRRTAGTTEPGTGSPRRPSPARARRRPSTDAARVRAR